MLNVATHGKVTSDIYTTTGSSTMSYSATGTGYIVPCEVLAVSAASAVTITLPPIVGSYPTTGSGMAAGHGAQVTILNLASQAVTPIATNTIIGNTGTIAANAAAILVADAANNRWFRLT